MLKLISKFSENERKLFYGAIISVVLALFFCLFVWPMQGNVDKLQSDIEAQKTEIKSDLKYLAYKDRIAAENEKYAKFYVENLKDDDVINADFLRTIEKIASEAGVALSKNNVSTSKKSKYYVEYFDNADCAGKLDDIIKFIHMINSSDALMKVSKLSIVPKRGGTDNAVSASMEIVKMVTNSKMINDVTSQDKSEK
ncbi:MAG: hypothetical protein HQL26_10195 [Candidatus Omnitrophica bacterium]|nr:hypothetical protein [Candidatus Omnitrophota bacterium]